MRREGTAVIADLLTVARLAIAIGVIPAVWTMSLALSGILVSAAWLTDLTDGRVARSAGVEGRMGPWDLSADTAVGAAIVAGLIGAGRLPALAGIAAILALGGWFLLTGNHAAAMLLQLTGYVPLLLVLWAERPTGWWLPFVTAVAIGIVDWRRLVSINIPNFLYGLSGKGPARP